MPDTRNGEVRVPKDADLALPRPPGVIRRFWARHPLFADILLALLCLALALAGASGGALSAGPVVSVAIVVLIGATCTATLFRRRVPLLAFILAVALLLTSTVTPHGAAGAPLVLSVYALAVYGSARLALRAGVIGTAVVCTVAALVAVFAHPATMLPTTVNVFFNTALPLSLGALVGINVGNRKRYIEAVLDRSRQLAIERDQQAELAAAAERARIAREMHDIVSHSLTVIVALSEGAAATADAERARTAMTATASTARSALTEMRAMLGVLRSDDPAAPLEPLHAAAPAHVVTSAQKAGVPVTLTTTGSAPVPPAIEHAIGRIVQEGVTNAMRHAPAARSIGVRIDTETDRVRITVANDGVTGSTGAGGYGIRGLKERARHVGGTLESRPDGAGRWLLHADLPLPAPEDSP